MTETKTDMQDQAADVGGQPFDTPVRTTPEGVIDAEALMVDLEGYAGPLDVLLELARKQKVDLRKISILALVEQYLRFVAEARERKLELAADYLVMAAWLTYLKTKLLLPVLELDGDEPTADEMAARLAYQLQRLEAMRQASDRILALPQKNIDFFFRGAPEGVRIERKTEWTADIYDLLQAYTKQRVKAVDATIRWVPPKVYQIEEARERLERILGSIPDWSTLEDLSPIGEVDAPRSSVLASAFNAALEFAKAGKVQMRQAGSFQPLYIKQAQQPDSATPVASEVS